MSFNPIKWSKKLKDAQRGFTLIEMLIVLLIIGIIVAVALPDFQKATAGAKEKVCQASAKTLEMQLLQYHFEHGEFPEPIKLESGVLVPEKVVELIQWLLANGYLRDDGSFTGDQFAFIIELTPDKGEATVRCPEVGGAGGGTP
ncbi:prepilin-type N-terminal cleavage/methylation domain-containing protein [Rubeoparvulum massiliense]|uniref:prepilin-type N-terminal cleavage/methylation domain-containing protein n=1 Tax=Rubeoparvulum massiliense TaxID=1631346 RepID=UPI00065E89B7|nr:prepilin-type N-terminal cleavage/methylation domain-containing protein [Rubeoparvulum massiliense]